MKTTNTKKALENLASDVYGANALTCDAIVIEWSAGKLAETHGVELAAREWKRVNRRREKLGKYTTIPAYGSALWAPYFSEVR